MAVRLCKALIRLAHSVEILRVLLALSREVIEGERKISSANLIVFFSFFCAKVFLILFTMIQRPMACPLW